MTVHALILRPDSSALEAVELAADATGAGTYLHALYGALGVRLVDVIRLTGDVDAWVDDEGRNNGSADNPLATSLFRAYGWHLASDDHIRGAVLFAGHDGEGGMASLTNGQRSVLQNAFEQALRM